MTKADKQLIKTLQNIKDYCQQEESCVYCRFDSYKYPFCQFRRLGKEMWIAPRDWDMEEIERIITNNDV